MLFLEIIEKYIFGIAMTFCFSVITTLSGQLNDVDTKTGELNTTLTTLDNDLDDVVTKLVKSQ